MLYQVGLDIKDRLCVVIGGGTVANRKISGLLASSAIVKVICPHLCPDLAGLHGQGAIIWHQRPFEAGDLKGAFLVFAATNDEQLQNQICNEAQAAGQLINVVDSPSCCSFQVPASMRQGDLVMTVSTNGKSPAVAAMIRTQLESEFGKEYALLLDIVAQLRQQILEEDISGLDKKNLFQKLLHPDIVQWIRQDRWDLFEEHVSHVFGRNMEFSYTTAD